MTYSPPAADVDRARSRALIVGVVGLAGCAAGFVLARDHFFRAWLVAFMVFLSIGLGSMAVMMVQHLTGGAWGVFRRIFEASSRTLPLLAILFVPIALGISTLYPWAHSDHVATDEILKHRSPYLNTMFWLGRAVFFFAGWIGLSMVLNRLSRRQDSGDVSVNLSLQRWCGFGIVFYALTMTFAGIDWIMALNPHWFSTLFGFLMIAAQGLSGLAFTIIAATYLFKREPMSGILKPYHFHDLGKLMFAFVMIWAYFNFSQYLLTFAANLAEEVPYMITRTTNGWGYLALFLILFHFFVPWLLLLSRDTKRNPYRLVNLAIWMLIVKYADFFMMISPEFSAEGPNLHLLPAGAGGGEHVSHLFAHWVDPFAVLAIGGLWTWMFLSELKKRPLLAVGDPYLREALQSGGGGH
jgi:hypothetical protein